MTNRVKYVHVTAIALSILVPFIPIIATVSQSAHGKSAAGAVKDGLGFGIIRSPPIFCLGTNADATFYSLVLPIIAILMVGLVMLITVFWIIHKVSTYIGGSMSSVTQKTGVYMCTLVFMRSVCMYMCMCLLVVSYFKILANWGA